MTHDTTLPPPTQGKSLKASPAFLVKADESTGVVEAIVSVFGVVDLGRDIIHPGAFSKSIVERAGKIRVVDQHNTHSVLCVLGKPLALREVGRDELPAEVLLRYPSAKGGLWTKTQYLLNTPEGLGAFQRIAAGAIDEYSIGYEALDVDYGEVETDTGKVRVRNIRTIKLWEYSPVIWGMNPATATVGVKNGDDPKELTADGPVQRLGDYLHGTLAGVLTSCTTWLYTSGYLNDDEWKRTTDSALSRLEDFRVNLPDDVALIPLSMGGYYMLGDTPELEGKAGRTLSGANAEKITTAFDALNAAAASLKDVLTDAKILGFTEEEDDTPKGEEPSTDEPKSDAPPTSEHDTPVSDEPPAGPTEEVTHRPSREELELRARVLDLRLKTLTPGA
jgi:HK97 family phage prohead protease